MKPCLALPRRPETLELDARCHSPNQDKGQVEIPCACGGAELSLTLD